MPLSAPGAWFWGFLFDEKDFSRTFLISLLRHAPVLVTFLPSAWRLLAMAARCQLVEDSRPFMLARAAAGVGALPAALADGSLLRNSLVTLARCWLAWLLGVSAGHRCWATAWPNRAPLERLLSPYIVASQAVPIVAIAPLLVIWFGPGCSPRC